MICIYVLFMSNNIKTALFFLVIKGKYIGKEIYCLPGHYFSPTSAIRWWWLSHSLPKLQLPQLGWICHLHSVASSILFCTLCHIHLSNGYPLDIIHPSIYPYWILCWSFAVFAIHQLSQRLSNLVESQLHYKSTDCTKSRTQIINVNSVSMSPKGGGDC